MCFYISLVVANELVQAASKTLSDHGRSFQKYDNPFLQNSIEHNFSTGLTTSKHCDCSTILGKSYFEKLDAQNQLKRKNRELQKLKKKGWSAPKIERFLADKFSKTGRTKTYADCVQLWVDILLEIHENSRAKVGLFFHFYNKNITDEAFQLKSISVNHDDDLYEALIMLEPDQLLWVS